MASMDNAQAKIILAHKYIEEEDLKIAIKLSNASREPLLKTLLDTGKIDEITATNILAEQWQLEYVTLPEIKIPKEILSLTNQATAKQFCFIPFGKTAEGQIKVAIPDPSNIELIDYLRSVLGDKIQFFVATKTSILSAIEKYFVVVDSAKEASSNSDETAMTATVGEEISIEKLQEMGTNAPIIRLVNNILTQAILETASDIHLEPQRDCLRVRYRVDGVLKEKQRFPKNIQPGILSRIKIMASMDIAERRKPLDGRISLKIEKRALDFRVSSFPTIFGEKIVLRILDKNVAMVPLENLGFLQNSLEIFNSLINQPSGMILISGPTGSGKTTTLYSVLNRLNSIGKNIVTIEDPVEYQLDGLNQAQVNTKAGITFANALHSLLRQDPDVILVGEIRDAETAQIAIEAALTGQLVFATIHTNDAPSVATRLIDMGIEPFLITSALIGTSAQRLARKICPYCKEPYHPSLVALQGLGIVESSFDENLLFYRGKGCEKCDFTGYLGRTGIHEVMRVDDALRRLILAKVTARDLALCARGNGMKTLLENAMVKAKEGVISIEEVLRVISTAEAIEKDID
jgi:type IV pilus assembly protein PilB